MTKPARSRDEMRREITRAIVIQTGTRETIAVEYTDAVMRCLDDLRLENGMVYVPAPERRHDILQIRAALERGDLVTTVQREFGISRTKLFEMFPGGLPKRIDRAG